MTTRDYARRLTDDEELQGEMIALLKDLTRPEREAVCGKIEEWRDGDPFGPDKAADDLLVAVEATRNAMLESRKPGSVIVRTLADVEPEDVEWLWQGRIPRGMLTILDGDPGVGKSTLMLDIAALVSRGFAMPYEPGEQEPSDVVILSAEDPLASVILRRLQAAGADLERIHVVGIQTSDGERAPEITDADLAPVEQVITEIGARFLVVDPLTEYLPDGTDTNSDHSVRRALRKLTALARRTGCAIVAIRHFKKAGTDVAIHRGGGSIAFIGAARSGMVVGPDPKDQSGETHVLALAKSNVADRFEVASLAFRVEKNPDLKCSRIEWLGRSDVNASTLTADPKGKSKLADATDFLRERPGRVDAAEIIDEAKAEGHSEITLRRAAKGLGISRKDGTITKTEDGQGWEWRIPGGDDHLDDQSVVNDHLPMGDRPSDDHLPMSGEGVRP